MKRLRGRAGPRQKKPERTREAMSETMREQCSGSQWKKRERAGNTKTSDSCLNEKV